MGVNCMIYLPSDVRLHDLTKAMGVAAGFEKSKRPCGKSFYVEVKGVKTSVMDVLPMCPNIIFEGMTIDGESGHYVMFHGECSYGHGQWKLLMPRSTPFWIAMGKKLIETFGGKMDCNDCDEKKINFSLPKPRKYNDPEDDEPWEKLQQAIWDITPITQKDLIAARKYAAYDVGIGVDLIKAAKDEAKHKKLTEKKNVEEVSLSVIAEKMMEEPHG